MKHLIMHLYFILWSLPPSYLQIFPLLLSNRSRDSVVVIVTRLRAGQSAVRTPAGARDFSLLENVQTGSEVHQASYSMDTGVLFRG